MSEELVNPNIVTGRMDQAIPLYQNGARPVSAIRDEKNPNRILLIFSGDDPKAKEVWNAMLAQRPFMGDLLSLRTARRAYHDDIDHWDLLLPR